MGEVLGQACLTERCHASPFGVLHVSLLIERLGAGATGHTERERARRPRIAMWLNVVRDSEMVRVEV